MIGNHIAERAGIFVEFAALFYAYGFGDGDLDMVNAVAAPHWFEEPVSEAEHHDVLDGFFSQEVIDAVDLVFVENLEHSMVQILG